MCFHVVNSLISEEAKTLVQRKCARDSLDDMQQKARRKIKYLDCLLYGKYIYSNVTRILCAACENDFHLFMEMLLTLSPWLQRFFLLPLSKTGKIAI